MGTPHLSKLFLADLYQFFLSLNKIQLSVVLILSIEVQATVKIKKIDIAIKKLSNFIKKPINIIIFLITKNMAKKDCKVLNIVYECLNFIKYV